PQRACGAAVSKPAVAGGAAHERGDLARLQGWNGGLGAGAVNVERARRAEVVRGVGEVAEEALALVEHLLRRQVELTPLGDGADAQRQGGLLPEQDMVERGQALQRLDVRRQEPSL